jgi:hypothetical protein
MLLNLLKAFQNRRNWPWLGLKNSGRCSIGFLKENGSSEIHLAGLKTGEFGPGRFSEALIQLQEIRHPIGAKDISPQVLKSF